MSTRNAKKTPVFLLLCYTHWSWFTSYCNCTLLLEYPVTTLSYIDLCIPQEILVVLQVQELIGPDFWLISNTLNVMFQHFQHSYKAVTLHQSNKWKNRPTEWLSFVLGWMSQWWSEPILPVPSTSACTWATTICRTLHAPFSTCLAYCCHCF